MTPQEFNQRDALEAYAQLTDLCHCKNAEQLAEMEARFTVMGLPKLASIVFGYGIGNAGDDYIDLRRDALAAKLSS